MLGLGSVGGGYGLFSPLPGEMIQFDYSIFFTPFWTIDSIPVHRRCIGSIASLRVAARGVNNLTSIFFRWVGNR